MRRVVLSLILLIGIQTRAGAQAVNPVDPRCMIPSPPDGVLRYTLDLSNGATLEGKGRYKADDQVQILFKNKNPFLFEYRINITEEPIREPALELFFKVFNASPSATLLATLPPAAAAAERMQENRRALSPFDDSAGKECKDALRSSEYLTAITNLQSQEAASLTAYASLKQQAEKISELFPQLQSAIDQNESTLQSPASSCELLVPAASAIVTTIQQALDESTPGSLGARLKQFGNELTSFRQTLEQQSQTLATARELLTENCLVRRINEKLGPFEQRFRELRNAEQGLRDASARFETIATAAKTQAKRISDILQNPQNFYETRQVGDYDVSHDITITVERREKKVGGATFANYVVKKLRFGGRQRFALGAGAAFTPLDKETYHIIQGVTTDSQGVPQARRVVGLKDDAGERVTPLIMLHTRIFEHNSWNSGWHLSFGFAGATGDNGVNLEYLTGLSISFAEERFFLTFGAYNGRTEKLQDGYTRDTVLPSTVTEVPVARDRDWDVGFALTFKFM